MGDLISLRPEPQKMTHEQLRGMAGGAAGRLAGATAPAGMRPEHAAGLNALLAQTRDTLAGVAGLNGRASTACTDFAATEEGNRQAIAAQAANIPQSYR